MQSNKPSVGGVWIFSGAAQCTFALSGPHCWEASALTTAPLSAYPEIHYQAPTLNQDCGFELLVLYGPLCDFGLMNNMCYHLRKALKACRSFNPQV